MTARWADVGRRRPTPRLGRGGRLGRSSGLEAGFPRQLGSDFLRADRLLGPSGPDLGPTDRPSAFVRAGFPAHTPAFKSHFGPSFGPLTGLAQARRPQRHRTSLSHTLAQALVWGKPGRFQPAPSACAGQRGLSTAIPKPKPEPGSGGMICLHIPTFCKKELAEPIGVVIIESM